jgi:ABC-2 type transport system permease protein
MKFYSLASRNMKEIYRDPVSTILGLVMPVALLILFSSIYTRSHLKMFSPQRLTPGIIVFCYAILIMFSATLLAKDRQSAFLVRLLTAPLKSSDFILAYMLPFIPLAIFQALVCFIIGAILGATFVNVFGSLLVFLLVAIMCTSLGIILGSVFTVNQVSGVGSLFVTAIALFSGAWTPLKIMGGVFESIGYALPFAHAVDATQELLSGSAFGVISVNILVILIYAISIFLLAVLSFRVTMKRI